ncbi:MAG: aminopeptidase [Gaiellaceae bacterium]
MTDPRAARLAELIAGYSLELQPGQVLRVDTAEPGIPLAVELYRAALRAGAHAYVEVELESLNELLIKEGAGDQLDFIPPAAETEVDLIDAIATIWSEGNTRALGEAPPERQQRLMAAERKLINRRWGRIAKGELRWCGALFPSQAHAQDAGMSLGEYERFVYRACHVEEDGDAVGHWQATRDELARRVEQLKGARELRITGPGTDLRVGVEGRSWDAADGRYNLPDGEVYTGPHEGATEGKIAFAFPALFQGREVDGIRLRFEAGKVIEAEARTGGDFLEAVLDLDDGARRLGEVAFGLNYEIDRFTSNTLFDEKIGGTMHVALGASFKELGGANESALHWDLVCDLREEGEVYADGELLWKAGRFL